MISGLDRGASCLPGATHLICTWWQCRRSLLISGLDRKASCLPGATHSTGDLDRGASCLPGATHSDLYMVAAMPHSLDQWPGPRGFMPPGSYSSAHAVFVSRCFYSLVCNLLVGGDVLVELWSLPGRAPNVVAPPKILF